MTLKGLIERKAALQQEAVDLQAGIQPALEAIYAKINAAEDAISELLSPDLTAIRSLQAKEFGAVSITKDGYRVTHTIPKKVKWDQNQLFGIYRKILNGGDDPFAWMKAEFRVGEREYNTYPKNIQAVFASARTVTPGEPKIEIKALEVADA